MPKDTKVKWFLGFEISKIKIHKVDKFGLDMDLGIGPGYYSLK